VLHLREIEERIRAPLLHLLHGLPQIDPNAAVDCSINRKGLALVSGFESGRRDNARVHQVSLVHQVA
jgi:hypothetical protein